MFSKKINIFLLITIFLITLLGVSATTAADITNNTSDIADTTYDTIIEHTETASEYSIQTNDVINKKTFEKIKTEENTDLEDNIPENSATNTSNEPITITVNNTDWTEYFNEDGTTKQIITPGSTIKFEGEINNKTMQINIPLNITTAESQAKLYNCSFTINADNINITKLTVYSENSPNPLIYINNSSNIIIDYNNLTIINDEKIKTHSIIIENGTDIEIGANQITTIGPDVKLDHLINETNKTFYTSSIESNGNHVSIGGNTIITKSNKKIKEGIGSICGVYVYGESESNPLTEIDIGSNWIITEGDGYTYGIQVINLNDSNILFNDINGTGDYSVTGLYISNMKGYEVSYNVIDTKAKNLTYGILMDFSDYYDTTEVYLNNNDIQVEANYAWGIANYGCCEGAGLNTNRIIVTANEGVGISCYNQHIVIFYNMILVNVRMEEIPRDTFEYGNPYPAGIKLGTIGDKYPYGGGISVTQNIIGISAPNQEIAAINSTSSSNYIQENTLVSPFGLGDNAIICTGNNNKIENNIPSNNVITDETFHSFFTDEYLYGIYYGQFISIPEHSLKPCFNNTELIMSGDFVENNLFNFYDVNVNITSDGSAVIHDGGIFVAHNGVSNSKIIVDGIKFEGKSAGINFMSEGNILNNSIININSEEPGYELLVDDYWGFRDTYVIDMGTNNTIANTIINVTVPSNSQEYVEKSMPMTSSIISVSGENNLIKNTTVFLDGTTDIDNNSTINGIILHPYPYYESIVSNNTIKDCSITVIGTANAHGINIENATDVLLENNIINVTSNQYANIIQMVNATNVNATGNAYSKSDDTSYGINTLIKYAKESQNINLNSLNISVDAPNSVGVLFEGSSNIMLSNATYNIKGNNVTAIDVHNQKDFIPSNITITGMNIILNQTEDNSILYFNNCSSITITDSHIESAGGSEIYFNKTPNAVVTNNYIMIKDALTGSFGNNAVISTEDDAVIENNTPVSKVIEGLNSQIEELEKQIEELKKPKETIITINPVENVLYGDKITISGLLVNEDSVSLSNVNVTLQLNDETVILTTRSGEFEYTTTVNHIGENIITATFEGNSKYTESEATSSFVVLKANTEFGIYDIEPVKKGETVTISGVAKDHNQNPLANHVVRLLINNGRKTLKTDSNGEFTFNYTMTKVGNNNISATLEGDDYYETATAYTMVEVKALETVITLNTIEKLSKGTKTTFSGQLRDESGNAIANAQVKLTIGSSTKTLKTDSEGKFIHTYTMNKIGENNITVTYAGNTNYQSAKTEINVEVTKVQTSITIESPEKINCGDNASFTGKLTDENGNAIANAQVKININGSPKTLKTDENGIFTHTFKMTKEGINNITAVFNGNNDYASTETNSTVEVIKLE